MIRDEQGRILLVDPVYKPFHDLPGGMVEANEPPRAAVQRELAEELGTHLTVDRLLAVEWVVPHGPWDDLLAMVFDGGVLNAEQAAALEITDPEISSFRFVDLTVARSLLRADVAERLARAYAALDQGTTDYSERFEQPPGRT
ncbi:hypothetical protein GCM10012275_46620 [Longimycelium tulufanense]|uniref:Nudix hydrolase domain-containing protein n=1 Tax=Longimycelium tulufanense TaxID=907463 RepID=A0A8J3FWC4_9PSEU|nr:NUDIX hydrolase [Longimycelium tulufanense]GGM70850.1 hypothetical protein GCM10012275_46620 [Longimycelium tulufanense]